MTLEEIARQAKILHDTAHNINSLGEAQEAVRTVCKLIYFLAKGDEHEGDAKA